MIRELITKFSRSISGRMISSRRKYTAPIKIWFDRDVTISGRSIEDADPASITGETVDLSLTGISFIVSSIRLKEKYLVGHERPLNVEIDLPTGKVKLRAMGRRYEKVGKHISVERFLVGAHIISLKGPDKENYEAFLRNGNRIPKAVGSLNLSEPPA